eukprot:10083691-Alexandrium_andersonii.AAC.1
MCGAVLDHEPPSFRLGALIHLTLGPPNSGFGPLTGPNPDLRRLRFRKHGLKRSAGPPVAGAEIWQ